MSRYVSPYPRCSHSKSTVRSLSPIRASGRDLGGPSEGTCTMAKCWLAAGVACQTTPCPSLGRALSSLRSVLSGHSWFHDLSPTPSSPFNPSLHMHLFPYILRRRLNCKYTYVFLLTFHLRYALDPFLIGGNAAAEGFSYYVLLSSSSLNPAYHSTILAHLSSTRYDIHIHIHIYTVTLTHAHSHTHLRYVSRRNLL